MTQFKNIAHRCTIGLGSVCLMALALALPACNSQAQPPANSANASAEVAQESMTDLKADPALVTGALENGLRYAILHNDTPPGQGALRVYFEAGSLAEVDGTNGLAHYLEHMAFNGTTNVPEGEMVPMLERLGLSFGADTNASTGLEYTTYKLNLPKTTEEILDAAFMLMRETASEMLLDQGAISRELGIILSEKRDRNTPRNRGLLARMAAVMPGSDIVDRMPIGTDEALNSITAEDFRAFYDANYHPEKTVVVFVGDADIANIEARIEDTFGDWTGTTSPAPTAKGSPPIIEPGKISFYAEKGVMTTVSLMSLEPYVERKDTVAQQRDRWLTSLANDMMYYRMAALSEQPDRPFLSARPVRFSMYDLTEISMFQALADPKDWDTALKGIDTELRRLLEHGFSQAELDAQLARREAGLVKKAASADTRRTTSRNGLIEGIVASLQNDRVFVHPQDKLALFRSMRDTLTLDAVHELVREQWGDVDDLSVYIQIPEVPENGEARVREILAESRLTPVAPPNIPDAETFAYTDHGEPGEIVSDTVIEDVDARLVTFDNNVTLAVKRTDYDMGKVMVIVDVGGGMLSAPRRDEGLRRMALGVIKQSGLEAHTPESLRHLTAGRDARIGGDTFKVFPGGDSFLFMQSTVPEDLRFQLDLFAAQMEHQAFRESSRTNHINLLKAWYPRHDVTLDDITNKYVNRYIRSDDGRFGFENEAQFYAPTLKEMEDWLGSEFKTGRTHVTIVGDIDPDQVVSMVGATFGALPEREAANAAESSSIAAMRSLTFAEPTHDEPAKFFHKGDDNQAQLRLYWPADDGMDPSYKRRLSVLRAVLRNRLTSEIRETDATTYSPRASSSASTIFNDFGFISTVLTLKPSDVDRMAVRVKEIANNMASGNITQDEFDRAIKPIIQKLDSSDKSNGYWLVVLRDAADDGLGLVSHRSRHEDFETMSVEDIRKLATIVLDNDKAVEVHLLSDSLRN